MLPLILRGLAAGAILIIVSEVAQRFPRLGVLILTIPLIPPAVLVLMYLKRPEMGPVSAMSRQILCIVPLGLTFFIPLAFAEKLRLSFWPAVAIGVGFLAATIAVYLRAIAPAD